MTQPGNEESSAKAQQRSLILMRHAKSDWSDESLADHDRPLNKRGRRDAGRMAAWLQSVHRIPALVLCSTAIRTRETLQLMIEAWGQSPDVIHCENLYLAGSDEIFEEIRSCGSNQQSIMVLGHNPGMSYVASLMADQSLEMPTAAVAIFDIEIDCWQSLGKQSEHELTFVMRPKALPES